MTESLTKEEILKYIEDKDKDLICVVCGGNIGKKNNRGNARKYCEKCKKAKLNLLNSKE